MKPLALALSAVSLALAVAACGGGGASSAGPAPSVPVETVRPAVSPGEVPSEYSIAQEVEYVAQADAICETAIAKIEAVLAEHPDSEPGTTGWPSARGELAYAISEKALAELRALPPPEIPAVTPVALCSHRGGTQAGVNPTTKAEYIAQAQAICDAASGRLSFANGDDPEQMLEWARVDEEALAELRALPQPEADGALLEEAFYSVVEQEIGALRAAAAATSAGDTARALLLEMERTHLTHQRDEFAFWYGWVSPNGCPVTLPA